MEIAIQTQYISTDTTVVELPEGKTWDDVTNVYVKWGILNISFRNDSILFSVDIDEAYEVDTKRPYGISVHPMVCGTDEVNWDVELPQME